MSASASLPASTTTRATGPRLVPVNPPERIHVRRRKSAEPPAELAIRPATALDARPLRFFFDTALRSDYFVRRGQLEELLTDGYHEVLVAELDGVLVGVAIKTRGTCLTNVLVHPAYRGLRIGRALIARAGAREVRAKLDMQTGDPRGFYHELGFESTGEFNRKGNIELLRKSPAERSVGPPSPTVAPRRAHQETVIAHSSPSTEPHPEESPVSNRRHKHCERPVANRCHESGDGSPVAIRRLKELAKYQLGCAREGEAPAEPRDQ